MQVRGVTSESLEARIRELLPSQEGFTEELSAQSLIVPVIDLTSAGEGSSVGQNLQTALAFGNQTSFSLRNGNTDLATTAGFWRIVGTASFISVSTAEHARINIIDATPTTKIVWELGTPAGAGNSEQFVIFDYVIWLTSGEKINIECSLRGVLNGSFRQIATGDGTLVNPTGFPL